MDTKKTLEILKKLRDHANGEDIKLPPPGMVQKAIETCIEWGEALRAEPIHQVAVEVAYDSAQLERMINNTLARIGNSEIVSIQYAVRSGDDQEHHPKYSALIHYRA